MRNNKKTVLALILLACMPAGSALFALDFEAVFPVFLTGLTEKHEELKNLAMPDIDIRTVPEIDDQAVYLLDFKSAEDAVIFAKALEKENIGYGSFPDNELRLLLFYEDMIVFIFYSVIGL
jgi:hypothetical protein